MHLFAAQKPRLPKTSAGPKPPPQASQEECMPTILLKPREVRFFLYLIAATFLGLAAKGANAGKSVYIWIVGAAIVASLADAAAPMAKSAAKTTLIALLRIALPLVAKHIDPKEVVTSVGTTRGISVGALSAAVESKGIFGLDALRAILAGAETDTVNLRAMVRGVALAVISNGWKFTAITEAEELATTAEALKQAATGRKDSHQQARDEQVRIIDAQLKIKLLGEDEIIAQQDSILTDISPLLSATPAEVKQWVN
jgi:hypothetical protein